MNPYPEIKNIYRRDPDTHEVLQGSFSIPEFEYLFNNQWNATEKVDGTNVRVQWWGKIAESLPAADITFKGRSDKCSALPPKLRDKLEVRFYERKLSKVFGSTNVCLYGEGYGAGIQKGGGKYIPDGVDFILFDVFVCEEFEKNGSFTGWWLKREDVDNIALQLGIESVPIINEHGYMGIGGQTMALGKAICIVSNGLTSTFGDFEAEGLVLRPAVEMFARNGNRIIVKVKARDFSNVKNNG